MASARRHGRRQYAVAVGLREHLKMTGTSFGCGIASCGACTVHVDGKAVRSCAMPVGLVEGKAITTIEGLPPDGSHPLQKAWVAEQVPQCGYCQSARLCKPPNCWRRTKNPTRQQIVEHMDAYLQLRHLSAHHRRCSARIAGGLIHEPY